MRRIAVWGHSCGMSTTIRVTVELRDRLADQAARERRTLGEHLAHLAVLGDLSEREGRFTALRDAVRATPAAAAESYAAEMAAWKRLDGLDVTPDRG